MRGSSKILPSLIMKFTHRIKKTYRSAVRAFKRSKVKQDLEDALTVWPWEDDPATNNPLKIATVFRCVRLISESVAQLPLIYEERGKDGIRRPVTDSLLPYLLTVEPMESMTAFDFWRQGVQQLLCLGNAYILIMRSPFAEDVERLILLSPGSCTYDRMRHLYVVNDYVRGVRGEYTRSEIIHLRGMSRDGEEGVSVLEFARLSTTIAAVGDTETRDRFKNGGNIKGFFTNTPVTGTGYNPYTDKRLKEVAEQKEQFFRLGGRMSYIPGAMQFKELMMTSADMQFLESRKFTVRELCRFFGVDPSFVFDDNSSNYKSVEMAQMAFLRNTLNPLLVQIEQELARKLLPFGSRQTRRFRFDRNELHACELETRMKILQQRISAGLDTPNEARVSENRLPVKGGDALLVTANLRRIDELTNEKTEDGKE